MIVRNRENAFVMIEQHHHAELASQLYNQLSPNLKVTEACTNLAVREAIHLHDVGWKPFDVSPFWNDEKNEPYDFITYPNSIKTVLYQHGIDKVAETHDYAALLCSEHYVRFLKKDTSQISIQFVKAERKRQKELIKRFQSFNHDTFLAHYEILQFFDNLSLYICLHEPSASADNVHYFFEKGMPLPKLYGNGNLQLQWSEGDLLLDHTLFHEPVTIQLQQKVLSKAQIKTNGLINAWQDTPEEIVSITVK